MRDDLCCGKRAESRALHERAPARQTEEKSRGVEIAGTRRIDDLFDLFRLHDVELVIECNDAPRFRSRQHGEFDLFMHMLQSFVQKAGFIERYEFSFIGEENIYVVCNQLSEAASVPFDAERIRQCERHFSPCFAGKLAAFTKASFAAGGSHR